MEIKEGQILTEKRMCPLHLLQSEKALLGQINSPCLCSSVNILGTE